MRDVYMIGNAHLDPVWLWQWREGLAEVKATFRSALDRLEEHEGFVFTSACAAYYRWVEENDPAMFEEIRSRVREGRWVIAGGMWIQPDMNAPSGESLARQLLLSQRYFRERFGKEAAVGYNVDTFGHNAMTPQILRRAGIGSYVWMRPSPQENPRIPEGAMLWEAPDGSQVTAWRIYGEYAAANGVREKIGRLLRFGEEKGQPVLCFYGVGNHGGGPTKANLREIDAFRAEEPEGARVCYASPEEYFRDLEEAALPLPVWRGELQHHASGCYSTHSRSKKLHREAENALLRMEAFALLSRAHTGHEPRQAFVRQAWEDLLFNEFHDVLGGCCLPEAMREAEEQLCEAVSIAKREENAALQRISWQVDTMQGHPERVRSKEEDWSLWGVRGQGTPVVVFNPHAFDAVDTVRIRRPVRSVRTNDGTPVAAQLVRASRTNGESDRWDSVFRAEVPALGWRLYWAFLEEGEAPESSLRAEPTCLENRFLRAEFDPATGGICRLLDKRTGLEALCGPSSVRLMDISHCDTWAHNVFRFDAEAGAFELEDMRLTERGPVRAALRVRLRHGESLLTQEYVLYEDAACLEVRVRMDIRERHRMVKYCLPTPFPREAEEIAFGAIERTACGEEEHCQRFALLFGEEGGLALCNDGRYSCSARNGELRMTIANTSAYADHYGQAFRDEDCLYMDQGEMEAAFLLQPFAGDWREACLHRPAALLNRPFASVTETYHEGPLSAEACGVSVSDPCIEVTAVKRAEDGSGTVLRAVERSGAARKAEVRFPLGGRELRLAFGPYQIRTVLLPDDPAQPPREVLLTEYPLPGGADPV